MEQPQEKIVVVGFGWVGQANALALTRMGYSVAYYDVVPPKFHYADTHYQLYERLQTLETPLQLDSPDTWYIVSIGDRVREDGYQDISLIEKALGTLAGAKGKVILRSTILPHYLKNLRFDIYFPEFLHELQAVEECLSPYYFVLGSRQAAPLPSFLKQWEKRAYKIFTGTPEEAAHVKYLSNIWNAVRIAFVNEFGDSIATPTSETKRQEIERILDFILDRKSYLRYGQGFGGHCLPKDLRAYIWLKTNEQKAVPLLRGAQDSNAHHEAIVKQYQTLPQLFSFWDYSSQRVHPLSRLEDWYRRFNKIPAVSRLRQLLRPVRQLERWLPKKTLSGQKAAWETWAQKNPYYYSHPDLPSKQKADEFEFRESGQKDYTALVTGDQRLQAELGNLKDKVVVEIGAGAGRMTEFFAGDFKEVYGSDISKTMLSVAKKRLLDKTNVTLLESSGENIPFAEASADLIFSYLVFKHLPSTVLLRAYFQEISRVLKPGGLAKVHLRTGPAVHPWYWFFGVSVTAPEAENLAKAAGLQLLASEVTTAKDLWLLIKKA